ncbi:MAG TPA: anhydro-N-acetylmuramic acid kinase [Acidobacteriota bacterium]|nr:anhydro-N-acetylmuramic acid kinase [Acidobacteriota bacterium]
MSLQKTLAKKTLVIIGLNSGTSADGLDMAALRFAQSRRGTAIELLGGRTRTFDPDLRRAILRTADAADVTFRQLIHLDNMLGMFFGRTAASFVRSLAARGVVVDAIASHGQTVSHLPGKTKIGKYSVHGTLQLGSPEQISALTGKPVIADFRQADVALGGEGAPITVEAMRRLCAHRSEPRLIVNIGGMANYFYFPTGRNHTNVRAADCGPGNVLCDLLSRRLFGEKYDRSGRRACSGTVSDTLLARLRRQRPFRELRPSVGREDFGPKLVARILRLAERLGLDKSDLMATVAELTVASIVKRVRPIIRRDAGVRKLYLTGGGSRNKFFMQRLQAVLPGVGVSTVRDLGLDPDLAEAACFAVLGYATLRSDPMPTRFDGRRRRPLRPILGKIVQPPQKNVNHG